MAEPENQFKNHLTSIYNNAEEAIGLLAEKPVMGDNGIAEALTKIENNAVLIQRRFKDYLIREGIDG